MEKLYTVKINSTGRFIAWCNECWYETSPEKIFNYTHEQAVSVANQMRNHYTYEVTLVGQDGSEEVLVKGKPRQNPMAEPAVKKTFGSLNSKKIKNLILN